MNKHTTARIGKRVHIIMHDGRCFYAKLEESRQRYYVLEGIGKVLKKDIRSFGIGRRVS